MIFLYQRVIWCKLKIYAVGAPLDLMGYTQVITQEGLHKQGKLKLININFTILNSHVTVVYLRFLVFFCGKTEKLETAVLAFFEQENC